MPPTIADKLADYLARREKREPVSHILGRRGFWKIMLQVTPDVLTPRPDTETAERDLEITKALFDNYGHMDCGIYVRVTAPGRVGLGDAVTAPEVAPKPATEGEWA